MKALPAMQASHIRRHLIPLCFVQAKDFTNIAVCSLVSARVRVSLLVVRQDVYHFNTAAKNDGQRKRKKALSRDLFKILGEPDSAVEWISTSCS
jgi:hypothetical protein